jgi:hypothetical protein
MILGATTLTMLALITTTPPVTIHTTTHQERHTMAQGITPDRGVGGGTNRQNRGNPDPFRTNLFTNPVTRGSGGYPTSRGTHPLAGLTPNAPIETTNRPKAR